ncbi:MAG: RDD family protein [Betaproteobacteria bacterium]
MEEKLVAQTAEAAQVELPVAGIGSRSYAFLIDWHIRFLLALAWLVLSAVLLGVLSPAEDFVLPLLNAGKLAWYAGLLPAAAIYFLYHPLLEIVMRGRTPGKRMAGVRIVTERALTPAAGALIIRNVFRLVDSLPAFYVLGLVVAMFTARQVRIGDLAAGTLLIYDTAKPRLDLDGVIGSSSSRLSPGDRELLDDLLERWLGLDTPLRRSLAEKFLARIGEPPASSSTEAELRKRLRKLREASRGKPA